MSTISATKCDLPLFCIFTLEIVRFARIQESQKDQILILSPSTFVGCVVAQKSR